MANDQSAAYAALAARHDAGAITDAEYEDQHATLDRAGAVVAHIEAIFAAGELREVTAEQWIAEHGAK